MSKISVDFNNMMANRLGACHGIREDEIEAIMPKINSALNAVSERKWGFMALPYNDELVKKINKIAKHIRKKFKNFVVIGIGGSSLGNRTLHNSLNHPFKSEPRIFVLENVDPTTLDGLLDVIDVKKTMFNVVTKSGGTIETMSNFMVLKQKLIKKVGYKNHKKHVIITTDPKKGDLRQIVNDEGYESLEIPPEVGGRFSVLSSVGLLSAAVSGINIAGLLEGARYIDELSKNHDIWKNPAGMAAVLQYLFFKKGRNISVLMPYSDRLQGLAEWFCQLWAESLGKNEKTGSTPVRTLGVIDQHSQLQMYMDGPQDKVITFIKVEDFGVSIKIPKDLQKYSSMNYLGGHTINDLMEAEQKATELAITKNGRPNYTIKIDKISPFTVGALMYFLEMQTAISGELFEINAFDQPGVEEGKKITSGLLGRPGYAEKLKEIESLPETKAKYII